MVNERFEISVLGVELVNQFEYIILRYLKIIKKIALIFKKAVNLDHGNILCVKQSTIWSKNVAKLLRKKKIS